ncbi:MAG: nitronate monooxygenase [Proteobacteria bacterium]|nr:nitronate monooxygenase [Pseudomonadota bacterium]
MKNPVAELLGCRVPLICGAMGVLSGPELVAAVSGAGGFGVLATGFCTHPRQVRALVRSTRALTPAPIGINLQVMNPWCRDFLEAAADEGIRTVTVSGGNPADILARARELGMGTLVKAGTVKNALRAQDLGADAIIAAGTESGGIQGLSGAATLALVPAVADAVDVPVVAAGGIGDARGFLAALNLGASGVEMGTRFIATAECPAHESYKRAVTDAAPGDTVLLCMERFAVRTLRTPLTLRVERGEEVDLDQLAGPALEAAWLHGDSPGVLPAGQSVGVVNEVLPAARVVESLFKAWTGGYLPPGGRPYSA